MKPFLKLALGPGLFALAVGGRMEARENAAAGKPDTSVPRSAGALTFNKDVAPIVFEHCSVCHHPGQAAPFSLLTYRDVSRRAKQIAEVVEKRFMPPWLPEKGHGEFADDRSLSADQIGVIRRWVSQGAREGDPAGRPASPQWAGGWRLGTPDLVVKMPRSYTLAAEGKDVYRNFVFPIPASGRKFVKGVEFLPDNAKVVHHAFITVDSTPFSRRRAEKENPPGFDGMLLTDTARMPGGQFLGWQPGKMPAFSPPGLSWVLEEGTDLVLQLHLHPSGKPETVQPSIGFYFTDQPPTNIAFRLNLGVLNLDVPPGANDYAVADHYRLPIDVTLLGISPHAHYLAKRMEGYATLPDGTRQDLLLIRDWDFNWQGDYRYLKPVLLPKGTTLSMRFTYDNSAGNVRNPNTPPKRVKYGLQTTDEMSELWFQALPRAASERDVLAQDFYGHLANRTIDYNEQLLKENPNDAEAHTRVGRAQVFFGRIPEAMEHFQAAIKANPKYDRAYYEVGFVCLRQNKFTEAQAAFENVVRLNPDDFEAHGSLGVVYMQNGDLDRAQVHLETALRINPKDKVARRNLELILKAKAGR